MCLAYKYTVTYRGGWVDIDTDQEPMELPEDHPDAVEDSEEEVATR
jgi:hypothetical protein